MCKYVIGMHMCMGKYWCGWGIHVEYMLLWGVWDSPGLWEQHQNQNHKAWLPIRSPGALDAQTDCFTTMGLSFQSVKWVWNFLE